MIGGGRPLLSNAHFSISKRQWLKSDWDQNLCQICWKSNPLIIMASRWPEVAEIALTLKNLRCQYLCKEDFEDLTNGYY